MVDGIREVRVYKKYHGDVPEGAITIVLLVSLYTILNITLAPRLYIVEWVRGRVKR